MMRVVPRFAYEALLSNLELFIICFKVAYTSDLCSESFVNLLTSLFFASVVNRVRTTEDLVDSARDREPSGPRGTHTSRVEILHDILRLYN